jgi:Zn-finger protein
MEGEMNCLLCFCPKYEDVECGGHYKILKNGVKDCSGCTIPHEPVFVEEYLRRLL